MDIWKNVIDRMDRTDLKTDAFLLELVNYQYGYIGYCLGYDKKSEAKYYLELAQKNIDLLEKHRYKISLVNAYNSAFCGFRISLNFLTVTTNGRKSFEYATRALEIDNNNYLAWIQKGNIEFYKPKTFGGSKQEGIKHFIKARQLMEKSPEEISNNWNYLAVLTQIAQSYYYLDDYESSKSVYEKILSIEPDFVYVRDELYPELIGKMKKS
jgi:tetratricopeptide (TPR) repeat protein